MTFNKNIILEGDEGEEEPVEISHSQRRLYFLRLEINLLVLQFLVERLDFIEGLQFIGHYQNDYEQYLEQYEITSETTEE